MAGPNTLLGLAGPGGEAKEKENSWGEDLSKLLPEFFNYEFPKHPVSKHVKLARNPMPVPFPTRTQVKYLRTRRPDRPRSEGRHDIGTCRDLIVTGVLAALPNDPSRSLQAPVAFTPDPIASLTRARHDLAFCMKTHLFASLLML
ncbi:hypothetical protein Taro_041531 [Colocasia esculenta]|uniref:Uncharacterized protein n=1 Tax=Colocasia esculenta TaxID=4460 RepID=A0A843WW51_COLES|nr:hypothetical protein [Colocasia esculenta]